MLEVTKLKKVQLDFATRKAVFYYELTITLAHFLKKKIIIIILLKISIKQFTSLHLIVNERIKFLNNSAHNFMMM